MNKVSQSRRQGPSKTRAEQKLDTRERIRAVALELFATNGFETTTTKQVADKAGVATGTVFVHASDKLDLLCLVMHDLLAETVAEAFATEPSDSPLQDRLLHIFGLLAKMYGSRPNLAKPFITNLPTASGPNGQRVNTLTFDFLERIATLVVEAQARGEIAESVPPLLLAQNIFALYFFALFSWVSGVTTAETIIEPFLRMSLSLQLEGLTVKPQ